MEISWKKIELQDKELIKGYLRQAQQRSSEFSFANLYLWSKWFPTRFALINGMLVFRGDWPDGFSLTYPLGEEHKEKETLSLMEAYCAQEGEDFTLQLVTSQQFERLNAYFPGKYKIEYDDAMADYIYEAEKLKTLSGKKLHSKRNHINRFRQDYDGRYSYALLTPDCLEDCFQMALRWREENGCDDDLEKNKEMCVTLNALRLFEELELKGGVLKIDGKPVAFTIGEELSDDTFVVHIEKAFSEIQGAYPMINQQFVEHEMEGYQYVNREEDDGVEGLRKAKQSYHPVFLEKKGYVTTALTTDW